MDRVQLVLAERTDGFVNKCNVNTGPEPGHSGQGVVESFSTFTVGMGGITTCREACKWVNLDDHPSMTPGMKLTGRILGG